MAVFDTQEATSGARSTVDSSGTKPARALERVLRITVSSESSTTVVDVAGELTDDGVAELNRVITSISGRIVLDLSDLKSADLLGIQTMLAIADDETELRHASPYIRLLMSRERVGTESE